VRNGPEKWANLFQIYDESGVGHSRIVKRLSHNSMLPGLPSNHYFGQPFSRSKAQSKGASDGGWIFGGKRRYHLSAVVPAARVRASRKTKAQTLPVWALRFGFVRIISPDITRKPSKEKLLRSRPRHSSVCVHQHKPFLAQWFATHVGGRNKCHLGECVLLDSDKRNWSKLSVVKLS
jgi:hypothetical protein